MKVFGKIRVEVERGWDPLVLLLCTLKKTFLAKKKENAN